MGGCAVKTPTEDQRPTLKPTSFKHLPGWGNANQEGIREALEKSCAYLSKKGTAASADLYDHSPEVWARICKNFDEISHRGRAAIKGFFEAYFTPHQLSSQDGDEGLVTGYYVPELKGSFEKKDPYLYAVYKRPDNLVMIPDLGAFREELKGKRIAGKVLNGKLIPFEDREKIEGGALNKNLELLYVDDPVDLFFLQIQGSGQVALPDGSRIRVGYDGTNGHLYTAIGRVLLENGKLSKEDVSMQSIKKWLRENPKGSIDVMNANRSYVFFRILEGEGVVGAMGHELVPERSLAVDRLNIPMGVPVWMDITHPIDDQDRIRRLVFAHDTGGAIKGVVRGDLFWGAGPKAEELAGRMKSKGQFYVLLPKHGVS